MNHILNKQNYGICHVSILFYLYVIKIRANIQTLFKKVSRSHIPASENRLR
jgi:hypothetical protein